ncbi:putative feruloyl esterase B-2 [Colletotrichum trifolii]|uniref:Carboxylic ester hydrolase n=1 Tax=Colletotrichum trifolii TaxID=5466 RepID=A0A4R8RFN2_COLTR|nr:putative feruloyl esterase B-2 [Colletotrichum trifolii]
MFKAFVAIATLAAPAFATAQADCAALNPKILVANSTVRAQSFVTTDTNLTFPEQNANCRRSSQVVRTNLCRIAMNITTSGRSEVVTEVWLPETWNGRVVTIGGGGLDGCVHYEDLAYATANGFAAVGTNNGHDGTSGVQFLNNEDVVTDFSYRAIHVGVIAGKQLVQSLYKTSAKKSYLLGCSLGGRQGIQAADMFPEDFDGIVAGAPAVDFNNLYSWRAGFLPLTGATDSKDFISASMWKRTIHQEVLKQCDIIDGAEDGIIEDPSQCHFDPSQIQCKDDANDKKRCLTAAQVEIVRKIYSPTNYPNGTMFWPGMNPGSEILAAEGLYRGKPFPLSENWFRFAVKNDPKWDPATYKLDPDGIDADQKNPGNVRTNPSSLSAFMSRGGKLLMYHGTQDNLITSLHTTLFYDRLAKGMNLDNAGMDAFARLFRISGMNHCSSGPGAWVIGQGGGAAAAAGNLPFDGEHNVLAAVVDWVENGNAPETLKGTKFVNDSASLGIDYQRKHCRYPLRNTFGGSGPHGSKDVENWTCKPPS